MRISDWSSDVCSSDLRFGQAIVNLLSNARDAVLSRAGTEPDAPCAIHVDLHECGNAVRLTVTDTGGGIPAEVADRIFDPFITTKESGKGTGLGLSIAHAIVRSEEHTSELQSLMRISYAVFCLKKKQTLLYSHET